MQKTHIEWVKNPDESQGITCNSKTGCLNGCSYCFARELANGRLKQRYLANGLVACDYEGGKNGSDKELEAALANPFYPRFWPERLEQSRRRKKPTGIFLDDMSDWMGDYWPEEWTRQELQVMRDCPQHRFYTLTKQPQNLRKFSPFPDNCWVGVTATDSYDFINRIGYLGMTQAKTKYVSFEPLLAWDDFLNELFERYIGLLNWLIIGACTGTLSDLKVLLGNTRYLDLDLMPYGSKWTLQPKIKWVQEIVEAADKAGVKVFLKYNLVETIPIDRPFYRQNDNGWAIRQEMPNERKELRLS